jgi:Zn-dependent protease
MNWKLPGGWLTRSNYWKEGIRINSEMLTEFIIMLPVLLISLVLHELAHGYVAYRLGDKTAKGHGRLTLNPVKHLDPLGSIVLFLTYFSSGGQMLFGWAKPVPINPGYFKSPQRGMALVGAAGPLTNFMLAASTALIMEYWLPTNELAMTAIFRVFQLNVILMLFNLIPVPPLDGSRILGVVMDRRTYIRWMQMDQYGPVFVMILLLGLMGPLNPVFSDVITGVYRLFLPSFGF